MFCKENKVKKFRAYFLRLIRCPVALIQLFLLKIKTFSGVDIHINL